MSDEMIHADLVDVALARVPGTAFERFVHVFYPELAGVNFVPLGGTKDGGADAALSGVFSDSDPSVFYQMSIQKDYATKIRATITRLRAFGRKPTAVIYISSQHIPRVDAEERTLSQETGVNIRIRDGAYIASHINDSPQTRHAFRAHLSPHLDFLRYVGASQLVAPSKHVQSPAVFVFLRQELERRAGDRTLAEAVVDSLILWALEGTDPEQGKFCTTQQIVENICAEFPFARDLVKVLLADRLKQLSSKQNSTGREIRHHRKEDLYCLPFETRTKVQEENTTEEALRVRVLRSFEARMADCCPTLTQEEFSEAAALALRAVQLTFEREGLEFAAFLDNGAASSDYANISDSVDTALLEARIRTDKLETYKGAILESLRSTFYNSAPDERLFLGKLARTYSLLFGLQAEPRIVNYFQEMASDFYLYVGTDLLVRALSERYVRPEDQRVRTLLRMLAESGATLVLAEPVLEEVAHHLRTTDNEFQSLFAGRESQVSYEIVRNCPKILIRAFFYARMDPPSGIGGPMNWAAYLQQFCNPRQLGNEQGRSELRRYLLSTFSMKYESRQEIENLVANDDRQRELAELATALQPDKATAELATNDALMALAVYERRERNGELAKATEFGFRTWWLTAESSILRHTENIVRTRGARYMMRPDFVLNFIALSPKLAEVRRAYENVFPSLLGVRLANRIKEEVYRDMMAKVREAAELEPGRVEALIATYSDRLKGDFRKVYLRSVSGDERRDDAPRAVRPSRPVRP
jgi:hypothetical protein